MLSRTERHWPSYKCRDMFQRLVLRALGLVPQALFCPSSPHPTRMAVAAGNQTGILAWVKAIQQETEIQGCISSCLELLLQPHQGQNKRGQPWDMPGLGDRSLGQLTPACVRPLSPQLLTAQCCIPRGREGELYPHGGVASRGLLLEDCQVPSEVLHFHHSQQLELFPELQLHLPTQTG